jgi:hypothetical protein
LLRVREEAAVPLCLGDACYPVGVWDRGNLVQQEMSSETRAMTKTRGADAADALETLAAEFKDFIAWVDHHGDFRNGVTDGDRLHIDEGNILYGGRREEALQTIANLQKPSN